MIGNETKTEVRQGTTRDPRGNYLMDKQDYETLDVYLDSLAELYHRHMEYQASLNSCVPCVKSPRAPAR